MPTQAGSERQSAQALTGASANEAAAASPQADSSRPVSDAWITTKVKGSLLADRDVPGLNVDVETVDGVVRLSGSLCSQEQIDRAVAAARSVEGVRDVDATDLQQVTIAD